MSYVSMDLLLALFSLLLLGIIFRHREKLYIKSQSLLEELKHDEVVRKAKEEEEELKEMLNEKDENLAKSHDGEMEKVIRVLLKKLDNKLEKNELDDAEKIVAELREKTGDDPHVIHKLGIIHIKRGDFARAEEIYRELTKLKLDAMHFSNLGQAILEQGRLDEALDAYLYALEMNKEYAHTFMQAGYIYEKLGKKAHAREMYYDALRLEPENSGLREYLIGIEEADGNLLKAQILTEKRERDIDELEQEQDENQRA